MWTDLEAATEAVDGIETEYQKFLADAQNLSGIEDIARLRARIDRYLGADELRKRLNDILAALGTYEETFRERAEPFPLWPWRNPDRQAIAKEFTDLLSHLRRYLSDLSEHGPKHLPNLTGAGVETLIPIRDELKSSAPNLKKAATIAAEVSWRKIGNPGSSKAKR